jgi:NAD(P)-dependent dehydrogenase (short-subunit alcohol dehydrogenase family)
MKHALITGGAKRIGREIALHLARNGWNITIHYNSSEKEATALAQEIDKIGQKAWTISANFEEKDEVKSLFKRLSKEAPPVTALIHNASLFLYDEHDPEGTRHWQVNLLAPQTLTKKFVKQLPRKEAGAVIYLLDNTTAKALHLLKYHKSRQNLRQTIPSQAKEYAPRVCVNALALGPSLKGDKESAKHFKDMIKRAPLKRASDPQAIAETVMFLLKTPVITGAVIPVDSGFHLT